MEEEDKRPKQELVRRADEAVKRALDTPPKPLREIAGKRKGRPALPQKYRGIEYSVVSEREGLWAWKLNRKIEQGGPVISGTTKGGQNEAIEAAHRAIDKMLGTERK